MKISNLIFMVMLVLVVGFTGNVAKAVTPFEQDVSDAIDDGITYLKSVNAFTSDYHSSHDGQRRARGLALLALLEKRENFGDPVNGYSGSSDGTVDPADDDQLLARQTVKKILEDGLFGVHRRFQAYQHGSNLMALTFYAKTGGPEVTNSHTAKSEWHWINGAWVLVTTPAGSFTLRQAIDKLVTEAIDAQGKGFDINSEPDGNNGFWHYEHEGPDSSTTQFAVAGLAAAKGYYIYKGDTAALDRRDDITAVLARTAAGYARVQNSDGGEGYNVNTSRSSYQQTASALWCLLLGGEDLNADSVQAKLNWQYQRYNYQTIYAAFESWHQPYYYHLWSSAKAYTLIEESGVDPVDAPLGSGDFNLTTTDIGTLPTLQITNASHGVDRTDYRLAHRNPLTDVRPTPRKDGTTTGENVPGFYSVENQRWYYDFAYSLMTQQNANTASSNFGQFTNTQYRNNGATLWTSDGWNRYAEHAYAILILERALGGACLDTDGDGICNDDDLCPNNSESQVDTDLDGIGDDCDDCPELAAGDDPDLERHGCPHNLPPVAMCQNVVVSASTNGECNNADASVDNGSFDPDDSYDGDGQLISSDIVSIVQTPAGPYALGDTAVTLTVTDTMGQTAVCDATVTVVDDTCPTVTVELQPSGKQKRRKGCFVVVIDANDNCPGLTVVADINGYDVSNGDLVVLQHKKKAKIKVDDDESGSKSHDDGDSGSKSDDDSGSEDCGIVKFEGPSFTLTATVTDAAGNDECPDSTDSVTHTFTIDDHSSDDNGIHRGNKKKNNHKDHGKHKSEGKSKKH